MRRRVYGGVAATCALALWACDGTGVVTSPAAASTTGSMVKASIGAPTEQRPPSVSFVGATTSVQVCQVVISASVPVDLQQVTIHMINGSNVGGPMIPVPSAELTNQLGNIRVLAGTTTAIAINLPPASFWPAQSLGASVGFLDIDGLSHSVAAIGACP